MSLSPQGGSSDAYGDLLRRAGGENPKYHTVQKFGRNPDCDMGVTEDICDAGGYYAGFDVSTEQTIGVRSSTIQDAGAEISAGTATGGTSTTLVDSTADFVATDGVAAGDVVINDTQTDHGIVIAVTATSITVRRFQGGTTPASGDTYRVASATSTGAFVIKLFHLLDEGYNWMPDVYVILNGQTEVFTPNKYIRCTRGNNVSPLACVGNITARDSNTSDIHFFMSLGGVVADNYHTSMVAAYTIPAGYRGFIRWWNVGLDDKKSVAATVQIAVRSVGEQFRVLHEKAVNTLGLTSDGALYMTPKDSLHAMTDIVLRANVGTDNTVVSGAFELSLEKV